MEVRRFASRGVVAVLLVIAGFLGTACPGDADAGGGGGGNGGGDGGGYLPADQGSAGAPEATYRFA